MSADSSTTPSLFGVRGHAEACARLHRAVTREQLHHGIIVVGPSGVGKTTLARGLACALHCAHAPGEGCGSCSTCRRILARNHAGVEWLEPEADGAAIKVAAARELAVRLELAPFEGTRHVVVFDPAEALGEAAFNALLKAIEEPRPGVHFVMLATRLDALLPTILSRCMVVRLGRVSEPDVREILRARTQGAEDPPSPERLELALRLADGRPGLAITLACDPSLDAALVLLAELERATVIGPSAIFSGDEGPLWATWNAAVGPVKTGRPARERAVARQACELWLLHRSERLRQRAGLPGLPAVPEPPIGRALAQLDRIQLLLESLDRNPNVRLAVEHTLLDLHAVG